MSNTIKTVVDPTMPAVCNDCGRPLTDPASRAAGRGPVCAAKYHPPRGRREASPDQLTILEAHMPEPSLPGFYRYTDPEGDILDISPAFADVDGRETPVAALAIDIPHGLGITIHVPPADTERVVAAIRAASGVQPDTRPTTAETDEQRADRLETEQEHAAGDHEHCGVTCEAKFSGDMLRNGILWCAVPGSAAMLDELLRRAGQPARPVPDTERRDRWDAVWIDPAAQDGVTAVHAEAVRAMKAELRAVADEEQRDLLAELESIGDARQRAEATVARARDLCITWRGTSIPLGTSINRWWDARLVELSAALDPAPAETTEDLLVRLQQFADQLDDIDRQELLDVIGMPPAPHTGGTSAAREAVRIARPRRRTPDTDRLRQAHGGLTS
ncbi:DUF6011 domain-containing protein [Streptomyces sp. NBC_01511]|uniref:DUF6011 domain-containing protein n=1 Tax=Streptomyces sp. NBC_01511 TaxID=2903889 RepID=UPI00386ED621